MGVKGVFLTIGDATNEGTSLRFLVRVVTMLPSVRARSLSLSRALSLSLSFPLSLSSVPLSFSENLNFSRFIVYF